MMLPEPTILILDEEAASRKTLQAMVQGLHFPVDTCSSWAEVLKVNDPSRPGCLVYHLHRPGLQGLEVFTLLRRDQVWLPVVVVSEFQDAPTIVAALKAGALTFLKKPCRESALEEAIAEALRVCASERRKLQLRAKIRRRLEQLTEKEYAVLELILAGRSNQRTAEELRVSVRTIEVRRAKIMEKMHAESFGELICMMFFAEPDLISHQYHL
jgi:FixJ family two-component response regulator